MPEAGQIIFTHKEVVEALLRRHGISDGIWALYVKFGIKGLNVGESNASLNPAAVIPILQIGLQKGDKGESNISVDAKKLRKGKGRAKKRK